MFYVYVYRDPRPSKNLQPIYVGKGAGDRAWQHWKNRVVKNPMFGSLLAKIRHMGLEPVIDIVFETEVEQEAFDEEVRLIALYGRRDLKKGTLTNQTDGGDGVRNFVVTEAFREHVRVNSAARWADPVVAARMLAGQTAAQNTPEAIATKSANSKALWQEKGAQIAAAIKQTRSTSESRTKTSQKAKAMWADPEYHKEQTAKNQEIANRPEVRAAKSSAVTNLWQDPEYRARQAASKARAVELQSKPIAATLGDQQIVYPSMSECVRQTGIIKKTLYRSISTGEPIKKGKFAGWVFRYAGAAPTPKFIHEYSTYLGHILFCSNAKQSGQAEFPKKLTYHGFLNGIHRVEADCYYITEDVETAVDMVIAGKANEEFWGFVRKDFPRVTVAALRAFHAQVEASQAAEKPLDPSST